MMLTLNLEYEGTKYLKTYDDTLPSTVSLVVPSISVTMAFSYFSFFAI